MPFELQPGSAVGGRYVLEELLGTGGMGQVWAATHTVTKRAVAVKFLKERDLDEEGRRRLLLEARASCAVKHPAIVPVLDVIESDTGEPALVMDLLVGEPLSRRLERDRALPPGEIATLLLPVAEGLAAAHEAGIVHRDLKPDNVFLTQAGEVKVLDFGIAKRVYVDAATAESAGTATGALVGTPTFMSPEQAFGEKDVDHRSDIWSLGLILYECLTGVLPTRAENMGQVLKIILTQGIAPVGKVAPETPAELASLVDRMLSRDREDRPQSMTEVIDVLRAIGTSDAAAREVRPQPAAQRPDSPTPPPTTRPVPARARGGAVRLAVGASLIGALGAAAYLLGATGSQPAGGLPVTPAFETSRTPARAPDASGTPRATRSAMPDAPIATAEPQTAPPSSAAPSAAGPAPPPQRASRVAPAPATASMAAPAAPPSATSKAGLHGAVATAAPF